MHSIRNPHYEPRDRPQRQDFGARRRQQPHQANGRVYGGNGGGGNPYQPDLGGANFNATATDGFTLSRQQITVILMSLISLSVFYLTPVSDAIVNIMLAEIPIEEDVSLGIQAWQQSGMRTNHYHRAASRVKSIGDQLVTSAHLDDSTKYGWDFSILDDAEMINAFALPGGIIRVSSGLMDTLGLSDDEVAALLGHEMGHVLNRHSQARILQRKVIKLLLDYIVHKFPNGDGNNARRGDQNAMINKIRETVVSSADFLGQQAFSRKDEYEADDTSWNLLLGSGRYNPEAMATLLQKLWDSQPSGSDGATHWESTHPGTLDRIKALKKRWDELSPKERRTLRRRGSNRGNHAFS